MCATPEAADLSAVPILVQLKMSLKVAFHRTAAALNLYLLIQMELCCFGVYRNGKKQTKYYAHIFVLLKQQLEVAKMSLNLNFRQPSCNPIVNFQKDC